MTVREKKRKESCGAVLHTCTDEYIQIYIQMLIERFSFNDIHFDLIDEIRFPRNYKFTVSVTSSVQEICEKYHYLY